MVAKQLSIFLENKSGRLTEVTEVLAKEGVDLSALCIAENADFGILRGIVSEPDKAYKALKDNHFAVNVTDVVGISCPNIPGSLAKVSRCLLMKACSSNICTPLPTDRLPMSLSVRRYGKLYPGIDGEKGGLAGCERLV